MDKRKRRTWAEIHLGNVVHNMKAIRASLPQGTKFLGVVKADAYGHGAVAVAKALEENGADYLAVAGIDEAVQLRREGVQMPILILGHTPPEFVSELIANRLTQTVTNLNKAKEYSAAATDCGGILKIHIKLDTGMSRLGFLCAGDYFDLGVANVVGACRLPHLDAEGIYTHFAMSDEEGEEAEAYTRAQFKLFTDVIRAVEEKGITFRLRHCANSGAVESYPETTLDMVRPGILLYGYGDTAGKFDLRPCMRLVTQIGTVKHYEAGTRVSYGGTWTAQRHTRMGVIPIGYADGLQRCLSGKGEFYTAGGFAHQVGRICMDMCMIDLTDVPQADVGDEVEIFGEHADLEELARQAGTISYELLCAVGKRVPRVYIP